MGRVSVFRLFALNKPPLVLRPRIISIAQSDRDRSGSENGNTNGRDNRRRRTELPKERKKGEEKIREKSIGGKSREEMAERGWQYHGRLVIGIEENRILPVGT